MRWPAFGDSVGGQLRARTVPRPASRSTQPLPQLQPPPHHGRSPSPRSNSLLCRVLPPHTDTRHSGKEKFKRSGTLQTPTALMTCPPRSHPAAPAASPALACASPPLRPPAPSPPPPASAPTALRASVLADLCFSLGSGSARRTSCGRKWKVGEGRRGQRHPSSGVGSGRKCCGAQFG